jgi:hypothetical protein
MINEGQLAEQFEQHRPHLRAVAYRMLGSLSEADDAVQEAWLRLSFAGPGWTTERAVINGAAGLVISRAGRPMAVASFTVRRGVIVAIDILADPVRLGQLDLTAFTG